MPAKPVKDPGPLKLLKALDHDRELGGAWFSPCGKYLLAIGCDALIHRWNVDSWNKSTLAGHDGWVSAIAFHPDRQRMFSIDSWGRLNGWTYADENPKPLWTRPDTHKGWTKALAISPDGKMLASAGVDEIVRLWSTTDGAPAGELSGHESPVHSLAFSPDGLALVSGDLKGIVKHWDLATRKLSRDLQARPLYLRADNINDVGGVRRLVFIDDGHTLACAGAQPMTSGFVTAKPAVLLLDWQTGKQTQLLQAADVTAQDGFAYDVTSHPSDHLLIACGGSPGRGVLWIWKPGQPAPAHANRELLHCRTASLHPDGVRLAVTQVGKGGGNGRKLDPKGEYLGNTATVRVFELAMEKLATQKA